MTPEAFRDDYLWRLDLEIRDLPHWLATDLRDGIEEELSGLDGDALAERINALGTPEQVAAAARDAAPESHPHIPEPQIVEVPTPAAPMPPRPLPETRGYAIAAVIVLGIGGFAIPFLGWVVGAMLVLTSKMWKTWEKLWGVFFPAAAVALIIATLSISNYIAYRASRPQVITVEPGETAPTSQPDVVTGGSVFSPPSPGDVPFAFDLITIAFFSMFILAPLAGLWLFLRMRGRTEPIEP